MVVAGLLVQNLVVFGLALAGGALVVRLFRGRRVTAPPPPLERREVALAACTIVLNTAVTVVGFWLWQRGTVRFRDDLGLYAWLDVPVILLAMDLAMYVLHRVAHVGGLYGWLHRPHHRYDRPRPLTLFVLAPHETLAFGALWLVVISVYPASWLGMSIYLALNVAFGVVGHVGVEPLPRAWVRLPVLRHVATSTFHAQHHADPRFNFGFYTVLWDRLLGTLDPRYERAFGTSIEAAPSVDAAGSTGA
ncbi:MAG: sterol desaturase family protein [Deltaproteobacteria bacterium]|nr:sterol desaturase family protein [Deltaproteobacteria bacterium]